MAIFAKFLLQLAFGLAIGMGITSPDEVSSGFFRNHLYVVLGLTTLAALVATGLSSIVAGLAAAAAVLSYVGAVCWLYEARRPGQSMLWLIAWVSLLAAWAAAIISREATLAEGPVKQIVLSAVLVDYRVTLSVVTSGLVLGITMAAMLLGHWYLNSPGMELAPLRRLLLVAATAVGLQAAVCGLGVVDCLRVNPHPTIFWWLFLTLRWSFGLIGVLALFWMAWQTLKIPNTQSATGILYVAVLGVFVGELAAGLLSAESAFPL